jgi:glycosyltransferase involved in cell wall biosynthesis
VSVGTTFVLPVYNAADVIAETIESILGQSDRDFELIVVDDGSNDGTPAVLARYAAQDSRMRIVTQANAGITRALIAGCAAARGTYIARHDAGDWSDRERLAAQRALLDRHADVVFVSCWTEFVGPEREPLFTSRGPADAVRPLAIIDVEREHGIIGGPTHHGSVVFRREAYERAGGYRPEFYYGQDWDLWYRLAAIGMFQTAPRVLYFARIDEKSISSASRETQRRLAKLSHAALLVRTRGKSDAAIVATAATVRPQRRRWCVRGRGLYFIGEALRRNGDARARDYLTRAVRACPLHVKAWIRLAQTLLWKTRRSAS